ncbi:hypothetical protein Taro_045271, partial [Colocasia esculenta]|nr:hypothetical protein [Colocasia esculenta]
MGSRSCYRCLVDVVCMAAACRSLGSQLTSALGRRRSPKAEEALLSQGELLRGSFGRLEVLEVRGACSHREVVAWSGGNAEGSPIFVFFVKIPLEILGATPLLDSFTSIRQYANK